MTNIFKLRKSRSLGFTLIELLVVISIIGVLAALLLSNFAGIRARARDGQRKSNLKAVQQALELYRSDNGSYPATLVCGSPISSGSVTYMTKMPCEPLTGNPAYSYTPANSNTTYNLVACLENTNDPEKDSTNNAYCTSGLVSFTVTHP